ncbi:MAG: CRISPR-associated protein Cas5 [Nitrososphaerales archaeon]
MDDDMKALHARFAGFSASFRHPLTLTGMQITTPVPPFSTLLGLMSACAGTVIVPQDTQIGFEFRAAGTDREVERTNRFQYKRGLLEPHKEGQSIMYRQVHFDPVLDLYVTNLNFKRVFEAPASTPCLGRSQDIAWIEFVREVELTPAEEGDIGPTLLPRPFPVSGLILRLPEWMENSQLGYVRKSGPFGFYMSGVPTDQARMRVKGPRLFHPADARSSADVVYIHEWLKTNSFIKAPN